MYYLTLEDERRFQIVFTHSIHLSDVIETYEVMDTYDIQSTFNGLFRCGDRNAELCRGRSNTNL